MLPHPHWVFAENTASQPSSPNSPAQWRFIGPTSSGTVGVPAGDYVFVTSFDVREDHYSEHAALALTVSAVNVATVLVNSKVIGTTRFSPVAISYNQRSPAR